MGEGLSLCVGLHLQWDSSSKNQNTARSNEQIDSIVTYVRDKCSALPFTLTAVIPKGAYLYLRFLDISKCLSFACTLSQQHMWGTFLVSGVRITVALIDKYRWKNVMRLTTTGEDPCTEETVTVLKSTFAEMLENMDATIVYCLALETVFVCTGSPKSKNMILNSLGKSKYKVGHLSLRLLQTTKTRTRKRKWGQESKDLVDYKYVRLSEKVTADLVQKAEEAVNSLDPLDDPEDSQNNITRLSTVQAKLREHISRNGSRIDDCVQENELQAKAKAVRRKISQTLSDQKVCVDNTLAEFLGTEADTNAAALVLKQCEESRRTGDLRSKLSSEAITRVEGLVSSIAHDDERVVLRIHKFLNGLPLLISDIVEQVEDEYNEDVALLCGRLVQAQAALHRDAVSRKTEDLETLYLCDMLYNLAGELRKQLNPL